MAWVCGQSCLRKNPLVVWFQIQHDVLTGQKLETVDLNRRSIRELSKILLFLLKLLELRWVHNSASHLKKSKGRRSAENTSSSAIPNPMKSWNPSTTCFLQKLPGNAWGCSRGGADWGVLGGGRRDMMGMVWMKRVIWCRTCEMVESKFEQLGSMVCQDECDSLLFLGTFGFLLMWSAHTSIVLGFLSGPVGCHCNGSC